MTLEDFIDQEIEEEMYEIIPFKYSITSYGADYTVDGLVKRMREASIYVPRFQRDFVWSLEQASRFIESLLLGLPVPGIFLSKEYVTQKLLVIDGQQRLRSLQFFYDGIWGPTGRAFALKNVQTEFEGVTYKTLKPESRRRLDDSIIHATIVKQDEPSEDNSSIYYIFERLNTGGTMLMPQEIRSCIFDGDFKKLLYDLNQNKIWRSIYGKISTRMRDIELILRFFALYHNGDTYRKPMKSFLNRYMGRNRHLKHQSKDELSNLFETTIEAAFSIAGKKAFKRKRGVMASLFDSLMVGIARRLQSGPINDTKTAKERYLELSKHHDFSRATLEATSDERNVARRIELATQAFADVK